LERRYTVDIDAPGPHDGSSWAKAYKYLQDGLAVASAGHEIWVAQGIYTPDSNSVVPDGTGERDATFQLKSGVAVYGGYAGFDQPDPNVRNIAVYQTILSGDLDGNDTQGLDPCDLLNDPNRGENSYHVVTGSNTDATAILNGFTITGGNANGSEPHNHGGGMYNSSGSPTVANCMFIQNGADGFGGGMANQSSDPNIINCTFSGNSANNGGGMYNYDSSPAVTNCTIANNRARVNQSTGLFANSMSEFSGTQGQDNWYYGFYVSPFTSATFEQMDTYDGSWYDQDLDPYYPLLWSSGGIPGDFTEWAVRRWISEVAGEVTISGILMKAYPTEDCGDGITGRIIIDGTEVWSQHIEEDDFVGVTYSIEVAVSMGSTVDFAIDPEAQNWCDQTTFTAVIQAFPPGGGIYCENNSSVTISNSILWGNTADVNAVEISLKNASKLTINYSDVESGQTDIYKDETSLVKWGSGNIDADPLFVDANGPDGTAGTEDDNLRLSPGSLCIDAGDNSFAPVDVTTDLLGHPRIADGDCNDTEIVDMGAYEFAWLYAVDFDQSGCVDLGDFALLAISWKLEYGEDGYNPVCDISIPADGIIDEKDLKMFTDNWLAGK